MNATIDQKEKQNGQKTHTLAYSLHHVGDGNSTSGGSDVFYFTHVRKQNDESV